MVFSCSSYSRWDKIIIIIIIIIIIFIDGMILGCMFHGAGGGNSALGLGSDKDSISALGAGFFFIFTQVLKIMTIGRVALFFLKTIADLSPKINSTQEIESLSLIQILFPQYIWYYLKLAEGPGVAREKNILKKISIFCL